jgi:hypothetical protein
LRGAMSGVIELRLAGQLHRAEDELPPPIKGEVYHTIPYHTIPYKGTMVPLMLSSALGKLPTYQRKTRKHWMPTPIQSVYPPTTCQLLGVGLGWVRGSLLGASHYLGTFFLCGVPGGASRGLRTGNWDDMTCRTWTTCRTGLRCF